MPLVGNLRQIALPDVLRVIENGQNTGLLSLRRGSMRAAIYFAGGQWLYAERIGAGMILAQQLVHAGLVTPEQIERATGMSLSEAARMPDMQLMRLLIGTHTLAQDVLREWAVEDAVQLLKVVLSWPDGDFAFEDGVPLPAGRVGLPVPIGPLLGQALRSLRAGAGASTPHAHAPLSPETVVDFAEVEAGEGASLQLTREQWKVLTCVDGQTPLWSIANNLGAPEPLILRVAADLVATGVIAIVGRAAPAVAY